VAVYFNKKMFPINIDLYQYGDKKMMNNEKKEKKKL